MSRRNRERRSRMPKPVALAPPQKTLRAMIAARYAGQREKSSPLDRKCSVCGGWYPPDEMVPVPVGDPDSGRVDFVAYVCGSCEAQAEQRRKHSEPDPVINHNPDPTTWRKGDTIERFAIVQEVSGQMVGRNGALKTPGEPGFFVSPGDYFATLEEARRGAEDLSLTFEDGWRIARLRITLDSDPKLSCSGPGLLP